MKQFQWLRINLRESPCEIKIVGSGPLPGKMLLVMIVECNKIDAYFGQSPFAEVKIPTYF